MGLKSTAIGIAASLMLFSAAPASAATFSFNGTFSGDADVQLFTIVVGASATITLSTTSYAGGGFDPLLTVFKANGDYWFQIDDGSTIKDPITQAAFDALVTFPPGYPGQPPNIPAVPTLDAGTYILALTQSPNFFAANNLADVDPFVFALTDTHFTSDLECDKGQFCDVTKSNRNNNWTLVVEGVDSAAQVGLAQTPLPAALPLFATGLGVLGFTAYRRRKAAA